MTFASQLEGQTKRVNASEYAHEHMRFFISYCENSCFMLYVYSIYVLFSHAHKLDHKYFVWIRSSMPTCMCPLQRDWCHKIAGGKLIHSDAHKRAFPRGPLQ